MPPLRKARQLIAKAPASATSGASTSRVAAGLGASADHAPVQSSVRLRGLFVGGDSGGSFALSSLFGGADDGPSASLSDSMFTAGPDAPATRFPWDQTPAVVNKDEAHLEGVTDMSADVDGAIAIGGSRTMDVADTSWGAPKPFMRQEPEEEILRRWRQGRSEARQAYKKTHQDAMRQRRKERATAKKRLTPGS